MRLFVLFELLLVLALVSGAVTAEDPVDVFHTGFENSLCPNNVVEDAEQCDDNNNIVGDGCAANCRLFNCGDGLIDTADSSLLDALSYEGSITLALIEGFPATVDLVEGIAFPTADTNDNLNSLGRRPNGTDTDNDISDWQMVTTITPGSANP